MGVTNIQVAVRVRPFLPFEAGSKSCIDVLPGEDQSTEQQLSQGKSVRIGSNHAHRDGHTFTFDNGIGDAGGVVQCAGGAAVEELPGGVQRYNSRIWTDGRRKNIHNPRPGHVPRLLQTTPQCRKAQPGISMPWGYCHGHCGIFSCTWRRKSESLQWQSKRSCGCQWRSGGDATNGRDNKQKSPFEYKVKLQFLELYGARKSATSSPPATSAQQKITIRDSGGDAEALGATSVPVATAGEAMVCLTRGMLRRVTGATAMNAESSRSHAIMSVMVEQTTRREGADGGGEAVVATRRESTSTRACWSWGNVISALASGDKKKFVPFRDSKLTRLLRGSLGGNHKTLMIACASPSHKNAEESLNCLRYANRAKNIQNKATVNVDPHSKLVNSLRGQVTALAGELLRLSNRGGGKVDSDRFSLALLEALVKGGKEAQAITIGAKGKRRDGSIGRVQVGLCRKSRHSNNVLCE
ncbi:hypothetical protein ACHAXT_009881 [Thalassiosira profunda]